MKALKTIDEMAAILKVPKSWLYARTRQKGDDTIPMLRVGRYIRFEEDKIFAWIQKQRRGLLL